MPSPTADKAELHPLFGTLPTRRDHRARGDPRKFRQVLARRAMARSAKAEDSQARDGSQGGDAAPPDRQSTLGVGRCCAAAQTKPLSVYASSKGAQKVRARSVYEGEDEACPRSGVFVWV